MVMNRNQQQRRGGGDRDNRRGGPRPQESDGPELDTRIVDVTRVAKVIKGGRRFAFRALIVVGDNHGKVGIGMGKARAVQDAIRKGTERARGNMKRVEVLGNTIPHEIVQKHGSAQVLLKPASPGTGVIAGGGVRAVVEAAGVSDILSKSLGSDNILNVVQATFAALKELQDFRVEAGHRGVEPRQLAPHWYKEESYG